MRIEWLEIQGFRSYGAPAERMDFDRRLTVLTAPNSQGKSSTVEAIEFLFTGGLERRDEFANYKAEFTHSLRNAHLNPDEETYVAAKIEVAGESRLLKRTLDSDYTRQTDCSSYLQLDGEPIDGVDSLGLNLREPPLRLPILMQHTLRYAISAPPKERSKFLKSLIDVSDLDIVREEVRDVSTSVLENDYPYLEAMDEYREDSEVVGELASELLNIRRVAIETVRTLIVGAVDNAIEELNETGLTLEEPPEDPQDRLAELVRMRQEAVYPVHDIDVSDVGSPSYSADLPPLGAYNEIIRTVEEDAKKLVEVFESVLKLDKLESGVFPIDCPVCKTEGALTHSRVEEMRRYLRETSDFRLAQSKCREGLSRLIDDVRRMFRQTMSRLPGALEWDAEEASEYREEAKNLFESSVVSEYEMLESELTHLENDVQSLRNAQARLLWTAKTARFRVEEGQGVELTQLHDAVESLESAYDDLRDQVKSYRRSTESVRSNLGGLVREETGLGPFETIADMADRPISVSEELWNREARASVSQDIESALQEIDRARTEVLDTKFTRLSNEVGFWWEQIRPDDPTSFSELERRGEALRYIDFKATLSPSANSEEGKSRIAGGVFSDSQLNALGVATFLARWIRDPLGFIVLDDPVLASDEGHVATFSHRVISELLDETSQQVIIATYSDEFSQRVQDIYKHATPTAYSLAIPAPERGTVAERMDDTLHGMLKRADRFVGSTSREMREVGAILLRKATERFCKELIVKRRRENGHTCSVADYRGRGFSDLAEKARKQFTDPEDIGKFDDLTTGLSPGAHDDDIPAGEELSVARGNLARFRKDYL